jgi:hypothetical protein
LNSLLQGSKPLETRASTPAAEEAAGSRLIQSPVLLVSLVAADLFLLAQASLVVVWRGREMSFAGWVLIFLSIALGAWLGSLAILVGNLREAKHFKEQSSKTKDGPSTRDSRASNGECPTSIVER